MTRIAFVVARDRNGVIGKDGALPWRLPDDLKRVRQLTHGKPLIMGRRTYETIRSFRRSYPNNIVLTRDPSFQADSAKVASTPEEALALAGDAPEVIVFGGAEVFARFLPMTDRIYLTEVDTESTGDTFFPALDPRQWRETERVEHPADAEHAHAFRFVTLERER